LVLFDAEQVLEADARILAVDAATVTCELGAPRRAGRLGAAWVHLVQALGKGDKPEATLRAAVALGVGAITFVESARSVARVGERAPQKRERLHKVAHEAARQSLRGDLPEVNGPRSFSDQLREVAVEPDPDVLRLVLHPAVDGLPLLLQLTARNAPRVELWVGPEGGFTEAESAALIALGALPVSLGPLVLRTELAATAALAATLAWALAAGRWTSA
jgi:16S rRNA (uracil1498-N3)-methyltransferase